MTENEIVLNLLDFYKSEGINMYRLLDDPTFKRLSIDTKVKTIKAYAAQIKGGLSHGVTEKDVRSVLGGMIANGLVTGLSAYGAAKATSRLFSGGSFPSAIPAGAAFGGAVIGAVMPLMKMKHNIAERSNLLRKLETVESTPTDRNAFLALALRNYQHDNPSEISEPVKDLYNKAKEFSSTSSLNRVREVVKQYNTDLENPLLDNKSQSH